MIFRSLSSVVLLIFISFLLNHYIQSILLNFGLKHVPKSEFVVFFFITLFNLYLIFILSKDYDLLKNKISEFITFLTVIGIVLCDIAIIHYLEYMDKSYRLEKKLLLEQEHIKLQSQYYFDLKNNLADFKQIIHDYKNHYQVIYTALINGNLSLAEKTMKKLDIEYDKMKMKFDTGIEILDIILSDKLKMAKKYNILLEYMGEATLIDFMQDFEIITIFGNILDNAIEANIATKSSNKFIKLHIYNVKEMILIKLINSCENKLEYSKEILKSSKSNDRGIGMINVRNAIERYDGDFTIAIENEVCTTLISVPSLE
ncbi:MAG: ATP-binding protein [Bacilli bacterium]